MLTVKGQFVFGIEGVVDFEVYPITAANDLAAIEEAMAEHGEDVNQARANFYKYAKMLRINNEPATVKQVGDLIDVDFLVLVEAVGELQKKLKELKSKSRLAPKTETAEKPEALPKN